MFSRVEYKRRVLRQRGGFPKTSFSFKKVVRQFFYWGTSFDERKNWNMVHRYKYFLMKKDVFCCIKLECLVRTDSRGD